MRTVAGPTDRVVVVGAGLAGLSAALRLAGAGRDVTVLEREAGPGGRAGIWSHQGYTFDTGPTVLTMPELLDGAFACVGQAMGDHLELIRLDPVYRGLFPDGSVLDVRPGVDAMAEQLEQVCGAQESDGYRRFAAFASRLYAIEMQSFIDRNIDGPLGLLTPDLARLIALGGLRRLAPKVGAYLKDPRTRRMLSFQAMYAGLSPYDALAIYAVISYMDSVAGVWFPRGGMHAVPRAMAAAAGQAGVTFRYGAAVERLETRGDRAIAALLAGGERIEADSFVLTPDAPVAYRELLPDTAAGRFWTRRLPRQSYSPSCFLLLAGGRAAYSKAAHHTISFGRAWRQTFRELIDDKTLMSDPSLLVTNASGSDPGLAPPGAHTYYVLAPAPNLDARLDWGVVGPRYRDELLETLERRGWVGFEAAIDVERSTTPAHWRALGLERGAPFAAAHSFRQTGPFRLPNLVPGLGNVVLAGSGTVPGVGVPMVLVSGRLAAERITGPQIGVLAPRRLTRRQHRSAAQVPPAAEPAIREQPPGPGIVLR
jgi:phytoene desaturase